MKNMTISHGFKVVESILLEKDQEMDLVKVKCLVQELIIPRI